ncbi:MAG TPA: YdaU family protein [Vicinamibacterales bacterium]|nr:YdaU family protein [Vicinamibacterales bacterium]
MAVFDHWMKFNVGDYLADTMHLSTLQHGIYILLIMHYFKRGGLPTNERELARIAKVSMPHWHRSSGAVMALFQVGNDGTYRHSRIDSERESARVISERRQAAGKMGASSRWGMANAKADDGKCHSKRMARARATTAIATPEVGVSTPTTPKKEPSQPSREREGLIIPLQYRKEARHDA